jgi:histidine triad (HIT) family protein
MTRDVASRFTAPSAVVTNRNAEDLSSAAMEDCLFCKIVAGAIPASVVRESPRTIAFRDINPQAPTHVLVIPREHYANVGELATAPEVLAELLREADAVAVEDGVDSGYRVVFNTGEQAGQTVFHVHAHVLGGRPMTWPPG